MSVQYIRYRIEQDHQCDFVSGYEQAVQFLNESSVCLGCLVLQAIALLYAPKTATV
jgi:hypothetical protein